MIQEIFMVFHMISNMRSQFREQSWGWPLDWVKMYLRSFNTYLVIYFNAALTTSFAVRSPMAARRLFPICLILLVFRLCMSGKRMFWFGEIICCQCGVKPWRQQNCPITFSIILLLSTLSLTSKTPLHHSRIYHTFQNPEAKLLSLAELYHHVSRSSQEYAPEGLVDQGRFRPPGEVQGPRWIPEDRVAVGSPRAL